jgi:predicted membrane-bound dolichyl-phosphate-mannose-protein mannosyltransferase
MKSIWTPGPVKWHSVPKRSHNLITWSLWALFILLLCGWLVGIATGYRFGGAIHLLALAAILVGAFCTALIFRYEEFLEPLRKRATKKTLRQ